MDRLFNLNSLTDIVSNAIGIAILLALVTFLTSVSRVHEVVVPVAEESALAPRFFVVREGALWPIDRAEILRRVGERAGEGERSLDLQVDGVRASVELTDDAGFLLRTPSTEGWIAQSALPSLARAGRAPFDGIDRERHFAFFFVYDDAASYRTLRDARRLFTQRDVRVGWTVVTEEHPPHLCASQACSYRPAMP